MKLSKMIYLFISIILLNNCSWEKKYSYRDSNYNPKNIIKVKVKSNYSAEISKNNNKKDPWIIIFEQIINKHKNFSISNNLYDITIEISIYNENINILCYDKNGKIIFITSKSSSKYIETRNNVTYLKGLKTKIKELNNILNELYYGVNK